MPWAEYSTLWFILLVVRYKNVAAKQRFLKDSQSELKEMPRVPELALHIQLGSQQSSPPSLNTSWLMPGPYCIRT